PARRVAVLDEQQDRGPERQPVPDARDDPGPVVLDRLPGASTVATLAPGEIDDEVVLGQGEAGRDAIEGDPERRAMRLACREESEWGHRRARGRRAVSRRSRPRPPRSERPRPRPLELRRPPPLER